MTNLILARPSRNQNASVNDQRSAFSFKPRQNCHALSIPKNRQATPSVKHSEPLSLLTSVGMNFRFARDPLAGVTLLSNPEFLGASAQ
jgi:hypothetical protein